MRALVRSEVRVDAPARLVFDYITDFPRQAEWVPLTRVEVVGSAGSPRRVGGRTRAWTGLGPIGYWDPMTVTAWEQQADGSGRCEVLHTGRVVRGEGALAVVAEGPEACRVVLWERFRIPGGPVGGLLWRVLGGFVQRGARTLLRRMAVRAEALAGGWTGV